MKIVVDFSVYIAYTYSIDTQTNLFERREKMKRTDLEAAKLIAYYRDAGYDDKSIKAFLRDGEALLAEGYTGDDTEMIDAAYAQLK